MKFSWRFARVPVGKLLVVVALVVPSAAELASPVRPLAFLWDAQYCRGPTPDRDCWEGEVRTMRELGFNPVEFWVQRGGSHVEGKGFEFEDLDRLMDLAKENGLKVTQKTGISATGRYRGVYSGMELTLGNSGKLELPAGFAELFVREEAAPR